MGDMRISMLVEMKAAAARAEAAGLRGDLEKLGVGATAAGQATGRSAVEITQLATASTSAASAITQQTTALQQMIAVSTGLASSTQSSVAAELAHGRALDETRARFDPLFATSRRYEMELLAIADAERDGALTATGAAQARARAAQSMSPVLAGVSRNAGTAAQSVAQLGFQFNDIGVMLAAGQNPLMLAVQQGTQITQVFDQMKDKGEPVGKSLKAALLGMLSPMNLVTMGAIAMGAVVVSALVGMIGETKTADEAIGDLTKSASAFSQAAGRSVGDVTKDFGGLNAEIVRMQENLTALARIKALQDLGATTAALKDDLAGGWSSSQKENVGELLGFEQFGFNSRRQEGEAAIQQFQAGLENLGNAEGPRNQLVAVKALQAQLIGAAGSIDKMSLAQASYYGKLLETESAINRIAAAESEQNRQRIELERAAGIENDRMGGPTALDRLARDPTADARARLQAASARQSASESIAAAERENALAEAKLRFGAESVQVRAVEAQQIRAAVEAEIQRLNIARQGDQAQAMRAAANEQIALIEQQRQSAQQTAATTMLADLKQEAEIVKLTAKYGADSLEVAYARAGAEREAQAALLASQGIAGTQADEMMRAWDAARGIASVNMAAGIGAASAQAIMLAANLGISLQHAIGLMGLASKQPTALTGSSRYTFGGVGSVSVNGSGNLGFGDLSDLPGRYEPPKPVAVSAPKTGGGGSKKAETDSVLELIRAEERELAVLRETDPVKAELLQKSEQLKGATTAQKSELEGLIRTRMAEKTALEAVKQAQDELKSTMKSAFTGWITGANSFRDALGQVLGKLAEMAASSAFDMIFSGSGGQGGGWLGDLVGSIFGGAAKKADGGRIGGVGGPREDNHLIAASTGEYIVNAAATANALPLLEAINAGVPIGSLIDFIGGSRPRAFADGGQVGVGSSAPMSWRASSAASSGSGDADATGSGSGKRVLEQHIHIHGATGNAEIRQMVAEGVQYGIELHDREILPMRVMDVIDNQRVQGR